MTKRGQFYIIAAVVIILIILGLVTIANRVIIQPKPVRFYDLSKDYEAETSKVIDYGIYNKYSPEVDIVEKVKNISETFAKSAFAKDPNIKLLYIYGNRQEINVGVLNMIGGEIKYCIDGGCSSLKTEAVSGIKTEKYSGRAQINVSLAGNEYQFYLSPEENFYFVIQTTTLSGERSVVIKE
ncbi:MAG: hypothetical protein QW041_03190 [Candidatus Pacearchaeota archaeon]